MKKLLTILTDAFLFSFLLIILAMPVLVSFNLDPRLHLVEQSGVAGVSDVKGRDLIKFSIKEDFTKSERIFYTDSERRKNLYEVKLKLSKGGQLDEVFSVGRLENQSDKSLIFITNLFADKSALTGIKVFLKFNENEYELFDGEDFEEVEFRLEPGGEQNIEIKLISAFGVHYDIEMKLELRGVNTA